MQVHGPAARAAVLAVVHDGVPGRGELHADLVRPPCKNPHEKEGRPAVKGQGPRSQHGLPAIRGIFRGRHFLVAAHKAL